MMMHSICDGKAVMVHYLGIRRGLAIPNDKRPIGEIPDHDIVYFGKVFRMPWSAYESLDRSTEWEFPLSEALEDLVVLFEGGPVTYERVMDAPVDRYEIQDRDTTDVWVMYRVAFRSKGEENDSAKS